MQTRIEKELPDGVCRRIKGWGEDFGELSRAAPGEPRFDARRRLSRSFALPQAGNVNLLSFPFSF